MIAKNNLEPKANAKNNIDRWGHLTGHELDSLQNYTRDQLRAVALKYGIKNASRKTGEEVIKLLNESKDYIKAGKKSYQTIFEKVKEKAEGEGRSLTWYKSTLKTLSAGIQTEPSRMNEQEKYDSIAALVNQDQNVNRRRVFPGHLCFFEYKAETPTLPYYDKYPLVYIFKVSVGEFWGANLHYLRPTETRRMTVINKLMEGKIDIPKKIIHKYLYKRCKSLFLDLAIEEWEEASALPVEDFVLMRGGGKIQYPKDYVWEEIDQYWNDRIKGTRVVKGLNRKDIERVR
jgi:hypothetical protein